MDDKKREIVISGLKIPNIESESDVKYVFEQQALNFLEISRTSIKSFSESLSRLDQLTTLSLHHNQLQELPASLEKLVKLKNLDFSSNSLAVIPDWSKLISLESINVSGNEIARLPSVRHLEKLHVFNASNNILESLPEGLFCEELSLLAEVHAENNQIRELSPDIAQTKALKMLMLDANVLESLPLEICELHKLKQLGLKDNKFADKKLQRLCASGQVKQIFEHVRKTVKSSSGAAEAKGKTSKKRQKERPATAAEQASDVIRVVAVKERFAVTATENVGDVRPYIVCCVVRDVDLTSPAVLKKFISAQVNKLPYDIHSQCLNECHRQTIIMLLPYSRPNFTSLSATTDVWPRLRRTTWRK